MKRAWADNNVSYLFRCYLMWLLHCLYLHDDLSCYWWVCTLCLWEVQTDEWLKHEIDRTLELETMTNKFFLFLQNLLWSSVRCVLYFLCPRPLTWSYLLLYCLVAWKQLLLNHLLVSIKSSMHMHFWRTCKKLDIWTLSSSIYIPPALLNLQM